MATPRERVAARASVAKGVKRYTGKVPILRFSLGRVHHNRANAELAEGRGEAVKGWWGRSEFAALVIMG